MQKSITWTEKLHAAVLKIAAEDAPPAAPSVKERAQEAWSFCRPGMVLEPWRVEIIQCLRSRLTPGERASHQQFQDAFAEAWAAGVEVVR